MARPFPLLSTVRPTHLPCTLYSRHQFQYCVLVALRWWGGSASCRRGCNSPQGAINATPPRGWLANSATGRAASPGTGVRFVLAREDGRASNELHSFADDVDEGSPYSPGSIVPRAARCKPPDGGLSRCLTSFSHQPLGPSTILLKTSARFFFLKRIFVTSRFHYFPITIRSRIVRFVDDVRFYQRHYEMRGKFNDRSSSHIVE